MRFHKTTTSKRSPHTNLHQPTTPECSSFNPHQSISLFNWAVDLAARHDICSIFNEIHLLPSEDRYPALEPFVDGLRSTPDGRRMLLALYHDFWDKIDLEKLVNDTVADHFGLTLPYLYFDLSVLLDDLQERNLTTSDAFFARMAIYHTRDYLKDVAEQCQLAATYDQMDDFWSSAPKEFFDPHSKIPRFTPFGAQADIYRVFGGDARDVIASAFRDGLTHAVDQLDRAVEYAMAYAAWAHPLDPPPLNFFNDSAFIDQLANTNRYAHHLAETYLPVVP